MLLYPRTRETYLSRAMSAIGFKAKGYPRILTDFHMSTEEVDRALKKPHPGRKQRGMADGIYYVDRRLPFLTADQGGITLTTAQKFLWAPGATNPCILPANYWTVGKTLRLWANLKWTAVANTNPISIGMCYGAADAPAANVVATGITPVSGTSTFDVIVVGYATCRSTGTGGTLSMWGVAWLPIGLSVNGPATFPSAGVTVVSTIDTTVGTNGLGFQALRGTAAGDTVVATDIILEAMN